MATRRERVVLELEDKFTADMARAAAAAALLDKQLDSLNRHSASGARSTDKLSSSLADLHTNASAADRDLAHLSDRALPSMDRRTESTGKQIDKLSGRLALFGQAAAILGPALAPIGAAAVPALAGLTTQLGLAGAAAGVTVLAFHGVGDALKALDAYQLEPTAANLEKLQAAMRGLGPDAREFVQYLHSIEPELSRLRKAAQGGLLPGAQEGLEQLMRLMPQAERIIGNVATTVGDLLAEAGDNLNDPRWTAFFDYLDQEARPILMEMGATVGHFADGFRSLITGLMPLSRDFSSGLLGMAQSFDRWAAGLSKTQGFRDFLDYVQQSGPEVLRLVGSLANMLVQVVTAAAPLGGPVVKALTAIADVVAQIAESDLGTPIFAASAGFAVLSRATATWGAVSRSAVGQFVSGQRTVQGTLDATAARVGNLSKRMTFTGLGKSAAAIGGLALATSGLADNTGFANTASLALMGTIAGPWGAAIGGGVGLALDFAHATQSNVASQEQLARSAQSVADTLNQQNGAITANTRVAAANALAQDGIYDAAQRLGVNLSDLTRAYLGQDDAIQRVGQQTLAGYNRRLQEGGEAANGAANDANVLTDAVRKTGGEIDSTRHRIQQQQEALRGMRGASHDAAGGAQEVAAAYGSAGQSARAFAAAVEHLSGLFSKRASFREYQAAIDDMTAALKQNGRTLNATTTAGRANQAALDRIAQSALDYAKTLRGVDRVNFLANSRKAFVAAAVDAGKTEAAAKRLADRLGLVGKMHPTPTIGADGRPAEGTMADIRAKLAALDHSKANPTIAARDLASSIIAGVSRSLGALDGRRADTYLYAHHVTTQQTVYLPGINKPRGNQADGGMWDGPQQTFADGGYTASGRFVPRVSQFARGGSNILWAEPETGEGEVYISFKPSMRERNLQLLDLAGDRLGADVSRRYADGHITAFADGGSSGLTSAQRKRRDHLIEKLTKELGKTTDALGKMRDQLKDVKAARHDFAQQVAGAYVSDPFGGTLGGFDAQLAYETKNLKQTRADLGVARAKGLSGPLYKALAASGNSALIAQFADLTKAEIAQREQAFATRNRIDANLGSTVAGNVYNHRIHVLSGNVADLSQEMKKLRDEIHDLRHGGKIGNGNGGGHTTVHRQIVIQSRDDRKGKAGAARARRNR